MASWSRLSLYGFTTYAAIFMLWTLFASYGFSYGLAPRITSYAVTVVVVYIASSLCTINSYRQAFSYGALWAFMHVALDAVFVVPSAGLVPFFAPFVWIAYGLVFITPLATVFRNMFKRGGSPASVIAT